MKGRNSDPPDGVEVVELPPDTTFETIPTDEGTAVVAKFQGPDPFLHPARLAALLNKTDAAFSSHPLRLEVGLPEAITAGAEVSASLFSVDDLTRETLAIARPQRRDADMLPLTLLGEHLTQRTADLLCATLTRVKERYRLELADGLAFLLRLVLESNGFIRGALHSRPRWEDVDRLNVGDDRLREGTVVHGPHENAVLSLDDVLEQWRAIDQHALDDLVRSPDGSGERASYGTIPRSWWPYGTGTKVKDQPSYNSPSKEELALGFLAKDSSLTATEIARRAGCNRGSLYRMPLFSAAWKIVRANREEAKQRFPKGHKTTDGDIQAYM